jgi:hypothetical protein
MIIPHMQNKMRLPASGLREGAVYGLSFTFPAYGCYQWCGTHGFGEMKRRGAVAHWPS